MPATLAHGFVFVKDLDHVRRFYERAFGWTVHTGSDGFVVLSADGDPGTPGVALHRLPDGVARQISVRQPPARRADAAIKLCFHTDALHDLRARILLNGGVVDAPWTHEGRVYCDCTDPEGNVIQLISTTGA